MKGLLVNLKNNLLHEITGADVTFPVDFVVVDAPSCLTVVALTVGAGHSRSK